MQQPFGAGSLMRDVEAILNKEGIGSGDPVIVAFSGGPDSVALTHAVSLIHQRGAIRAIGCHLNHQLRGADADEDEAFVRERLQQLNMEVRVRRQNVSEFAKLHKLNEEEAGRICRYAFFAEVAAQSGAKMVLLAHHADDQVETVVWRLIRGAGTRGMSGMKPIRREGGITYARPFLNRTKQELLAYCQLNELTYRTDKSNQELRYTRNAIRRELIPLMKTWNPNLVKQTLQTAAILADEDAWMQQMTMTWVQEHVFFQAQNPRVRWDRRTFVELPIALQRRVIKLILNYLSLPTEAFPFVRIETILQGMHCPDDPNRRMALSDQLDLIRSYDRIEICNALARHTDSYQQEWNLQISASISIPIVNGTFKMERMSVIDATACIGDLNCYLFEDHGGPMVYSVRNRRPGDRMVWFADGSRKKLKDAWIDAKWNAWQRANWPILVSAEGELLWIPGFRHASMDRLDLTARHKGTWIVIRWIGPAPIGSHANVDERTT